MKKYRENSTLSKHKGLIASDNELKLLHDDELASVTAGKIYTASKDGNTEVHHGITFTCNGILNCTHYQWVCGKCKNIIDGSNLEIHAKGCNFGAPAIN
ncbi:MAG: hypothetical protein LBJ95_03145 [Oscillospiraceae bacterium]|nr:hypothetical protein [Oscillospiraceae bacterium]